MSIVFENPGVIDPRGITTLGVNVKEGSSPIGFFGTGLKYAICVILRLGGEIRIYAGEDVHEFTLKTITMRGKEFQVVVMDGQELGFTTEFGKNWEAWMAYRELFSNVKDEDGRVYHLFDTESLPALEGYTQIVVDCEEMMNAHMMRGTFLLEERTPRFTIPGQVEVYDGGSSFIFYRGIRAGEVPTGKRSRFTYNVLRHCDLTEDRTINSSYYARLVAEMAITQSTDAAFIAECLTEKAEDMMERQIDFTYSGDAPSATFFAVVDEIKKTRAGDLNDGALKKVRKHRPESSAPDGRPFTSAESEMLEAAKDFARSIGFDCSNHTIRCAQTLGDETLALAIMKENIMILSAQCFDMGLRTVVEALIEEHLHLVSGHQDCSRTMQNRLFSEIIRLGEELSGISLDQMAKAA